MGGVRRASSIFAVVFFATSALFLGALLVVLQ